MKTMYAILALSAIQAFSFPTPIEKPSHTVEEASRLVLNHHKKKGFSSRDWNTHFIQKTEYTNYECSIDLQRTFRKENLEEMKTKGRAWIYEEWGWVVKVIMGYDASQSNVYFVRKSGEVELLWETM